MIHSKLALTNSLEFFIGEREIQANMREYGVHSGPYAGETKGCMSLGEGIETKVEKSSEFN